MLTRTEFYHTASLDRILSYNFTMIRFYHTANIKQGLDAWKNGGTRDCVQNAELHGLLAKKAKSADLSDPMIGNNLLLSFGKDLLWPEQTELL